MLNRKLYRDVARMWAQALAVALVMACGVATIILAVGATRSLEDTRTAFYDRYRFATIFAGATRAPDNLLDDLAAIEGVNGVELRIVTPAILDMPGMAEPATAVVVSIPDAGEPAVNRLYVRAGRLPVAGRNNEAVVTENFARAHRLQPGSHVSAVVNGRQVDLTLTGIVLSPEYIYALGPGDMVPDERRFGVLFMGRSALGGLLSMSGAFNDVVLRTGRGISPQGVIDRLDSLLKPYGGTGAHDRSGQISHQFLDNELVQLRAMSQVIPPIFLFVSAFLVNMILMRLITLEREQVGLLKALGYPDWAIGWHYAKFALIVAFIGIVIGIVTGTVFGHSLTQLYGRFFSFPFLVFSQSPDIYAIAAGTTAAAGLSGAIRAVSSVITLPAAVAMQPPAPPRYRKLFGRGSRVFVLFSQLTVIAFRHLIRWPVRSGLAMLGTSMSVAILVTALFSFDSIAFMVDAVFYRAERQDATVAFTHDVSPSAAFDVSRLPGVLQAEPFRSVPVILRNGYRERRLALSSASGNDELAQVLNTDLQKVEVPENGLLISKRLAEILSVTVGDRVEAELLADGHRLEPVIISGIVESYVGLAAYMDSGALDRLAGNGPRISAVRISMDTRMTGAFYAAVKKTPMISSIALQSTARQKFKQTIEQNISMMMSVYVGLAVIITFGVIYNSARIQLSEHARELASLRVLGFTRGEVANVLMVELASVVVMAQPLGWLLGYLFSWSVVRGFASDLFTIPFVVEPSTFAIASLVVLAVSAFSAAIVRRRINQFDLVSVLKTRE